tara:strand:- start:948 stop:1436 length:489 start_codon:yes stop_codon:yes gene_type:complete
MDELVLNNRRLKLVDGEIWSWKEYKHNPCWRKIKYSIKENGYYYINLQNNKIQKGYYLHRLIYKFYNPEWDIHDSSSDNQVDHFDNDKTNNNIENLRIVTHSENQQNTLSTKGYNFHKHSNKYRAYINVNYKHHYLGYYDTAEEARDAYLIAKKKYHIICYL